MIHFICSGSFFVNTVCPFGRFWFCSQALWALLGGNSSFLFIWILCFCCCCRCLSTLVQYICSCFPSDRLFPFSLSRSRVADLFTFVLFVCFDKQYYRIVPNDDIFCGQYIFKLHAHTHTYNAHSRSYIQSNMPVIMSASHRAHFSSSMHIFTSESLRFVCVWTF